MTHVYNFNPERAFDIIVTHWLEWHRCNATDQTKYTVGISGGIDSAVVAALAVKIFGADKVIGLLLPNGAQKDISDARAVYNALHIDARQLNIEYAYKSIIGALPVANISETTKINLAPRLRMAALYAFAQSENAFVLNTSNLSESMLNYDTIFGDDTGAYAPVQELTKSEIVSLAKWLGTVPTEVIEKKPADGLQSMSDEERLGVKYAEVDDFIRLNIGTPELKQKVLARYRSGKFKLSTVHLEGPVFNWPNFVKILNCE